MAPQQSHYSLRWKNHQSHILSEFDALLQAETLVDVTLVCSEISVRAHKVVLSACSPFFQKIFAENPCKHPVIVLKDFQGWIIQAIVDFMYKGEISVDHEQLPFLIKAADNLQIRGLSLNENDYVCRKKVRSLSRQELSELTGTVDDANSNDADADADESEEVGELLLNGNCSFLDSFASRAKFSPSLNLPRRKQTKPRRRSTEQNVQDLTLRKEKIVDDQPENLSMKKELPISTDEVQKSSKPQTPESLVSTEIESNVTSDKFDLLSPPHSNLPAAHSMISNQLSTDFNGYKSPLPFTQLPSSTSSLSLPSPTYFGLDAALNLYTPPIIDNYRSNIFDLPELKSTVDHQTPLYMKKKMGRPKGQHSAPRGGPPRSWTNAELTQALEHVWNRKLTTSQASRLFGIPYNSLLMYVRGKYGKSLKLEQLRNNCMGAQNTNSSDLLSTLNNNNSLTRNNNNNNISNKNNNSNNNNNNGTILKPEKQFDSIVQSTRTPSISDDIHNAIFNPFMTNIFSDFASSNYPMSLNMLNYLPPKTEKTSEFNFNLSLTDPLVTTAESLILPHENNNTPNNANKSVIKEEIYTSSI